MVGWLSAWLTVWLVVFVFLQTPVPGWAYTQATLFQKASHRLELQYICVPTGKLRLAESSSRDVLWKSLKSKSFCFTHLKVGILTGYVKKKNNTYGGKIITYCGCVFPLIYSFRYFSIMNSSFQTVFTWIYFGFQLRFSFAGATPQYGSENIWYCGVIWTSSNMVILSLYTQLSSS